MRISNCYRHTYSTVLNFSEVPVRTCTLNSHCKWRHTMYVSADQKCPEMRILRPNSQNNQLSLAVLRTPQRHPSLGTALPSKTTQWHSKCFVSCTHGKQGLRSCILRSTEITKQCLSATETAGYKELIIAPGYLIIMIVLLASEH